MSQDKLQGFKFGNNPYDEGNKLERYEQQDMEAIREQKESVDNLHEGLQKEEVDDL
jgi:hypothetical protein